MPQNSNVLKVNESKVHYRPQTENEKQLVSNLEKVTGIFTELYKSSRHSELVSIAIRSKAYTDESVLLRDLIFYNNSRLLANKVFTETISKRNLSLNNFSSEFWKIVELKQDIQLKSFLNTLNSTSSNNTREINDNSSPQQQVTVYFPYSDHFPDQSGGGNPMFISIITATADADEGIGQRPILDQNGLVIGFDNVIINDDYAANNPTHIIGLNGVEPYDITARMDSIPPTPPPAPTPIFNRVFIGEGICKVQYDRLISFTGNGGGSEVKYNRITGYLQPVNGQVTTFQDIVSANFSRRDIRNERWVRLMGIWDADWSPNENEQILAIFEEDNTHTRSFNGSISTTLDSFGIPIQASIGFNVTIQSQDEIIRQLKISRAAYFAAAFRDQGNGFTPDQTFLPTNSPNLRWPAYEVHYQWKSGANVGWTWPYDRF